MDTYILQAARNVAIFINDNATLLSHSNQKIMIGHNTLQVQSVLPGILLLAPHFAYRVKEMRLRLTRSTNLVSSSFGGDGK